MIHGWQLFDDRLDYAVAVSNGEINGNTDTNDEQGHQRPDRLSAVQSPGEGSRCDRLGFGVSGGEGVENEALNTSTSPNLKTPATVPWSAYNTGGPRQRPAHPAQPRADLFLPSASALPPSTITRSRNCRLYHAAPTDNVNIEGFYVMASYLLTGEHRADYSEQIEPAASLRSALPVLLAGGLGSALPRFPPACDSGVSRPARKTWPTRPI